MSRQRETKHIKNKQQLYRQTVQSQASFNGECPIWTFKNVDKDGIFRFDPNRKDFNSQDFLNKMLAFSKMTWNKIKEQKHDNNKSKHHTLSVGSLSKDAEERIKAKCLEDFTDNIFSFALNNMVRVIGIRSSDSPEFKVVWYDAKHQFAPSKK